MSSTESSAPGARQRCPPAALFASPGPTDPPEVPCLGEGVNALIPRQDPVGEKLLLRVQKALGERKDAQVSAQGLPASSAAQGTGKRQPPGEAESGGSGTAAAGPKVRIPPGLLPRQQARGAKLVRLAELQQEVPKGTAATSTPP